jgi:hypothetical protein
MNWYISGLSEYAFLIGSYRYKQQQSFMILFPFSSILKSLWNGVTHHFHVRVMQAFTSMQFCLPLMRKLLMPWNPASLEKVKTVKELIVGDWGRLIIQPV